MWILFLFRGNPHMLYHVHMSGSVSETCMEVCLFDPTPVTQNNIAAVMFRWCGVRSVGHRNNGSCVCVFWASQQSTQCFCRMFQAVGANTSWHRLLPPYSRADIVEKSPRHWRTVHCLTSPLKRFCSLKQLMLPSENEALKVLTGNKWTKLKLK